MKRSNASGSSNVNDYEIPQYSYESAFFATTDTSSYDGEAMSTSSKLKGRKKNFKLLPVKVKDLVGMVENNPDYAGKSPVMIKMREHDLDEIIEQQRAGNSVVLTASPKSLRTSKELTSPKKRSVHENKTNTNPPLGGGEAQATQVYAMTDYPVYPMANIQAFPAVGRSGFRIDSARPVVTRKPQSRSRYRARQTRSTSRKPRSRYRMRQTRSTSRNAPILDRFFARSRTRSRPRVRVRSSQRSIRPVRRRTPSRAVVRKRCRTPKHMRLRKQTPVIVKRRKTRTLQKRRRSAFVDPCAPVCAPYPMCDRQCDINYCTRWSPNRSRRNMLQCDCNLCQGKLQFIQPGVCTKKKAMWTNEYAIIPKPQVNLIDPCEKLDPIIYPRADRPCIRDGRGNPLTDCIGRPLRDPVGKNFMRLSANGSLLETNFRGNYHTGQPPLCVKCPLPDIYSCKPDTTHNWWTGCGYPILPNMTPFYNNIVTSENVARY